MKKQLLTVAAAAGILFTFFSASASAGEISYNVKSGDTLWEISRSYNVSVNDLRAWNNLSGSLIYTGQQLAITTPSNNTQPSTVTASGNTYIVKSGDSLWGIANAHGISVSELKNMNNLQKDMIYPGQTVQVTGTRAAPSAPVTNVSSNGTYRVQAGDTLSKIAVRHQISLSQLKAINNLSSDLIRVGQVLKVNNQATVSAPVAVQPVQQVASVTNGSVNRLITEAKKYIGSPYKWGGSAPSGFDCSGYLNFVFNKAGVSIPRTVASIWNATASISSPRAGDIVFFETYKSGPSHAGIYLGNNKFIHAGSSRGVEISDLNNSYWKPRYLGAKTAF
ncbi:peptidoglycan endopeptidase [Bacillus canaveralius]|uniref:Peptidoglycan endopeptidase n=1 Tax=Bacillus canaveralius TaxID=1403243 RepID=A0A2N5GFL7_9BACI|nr:LysM peptidoglycan-binding domain-containing protein [Bacillus canaveralius]PLR79564.1 peptidoglycan endopeptidase [Bacillus canaveralius]PLR88120.1 peptidoglycan endopeptidase [Bacillus canaveralius]